MRIWPIRGQVGADLAADVADGVARQARGLRAVEDRLAAADVAPGERRQDRFEPGLLLGGVDVQRGVERLGLGADRSRRTCRGGA